MNGRDVFNLLESLGIERLRMNTKGQLSGLCPLHAEVHPSFGVSAEKLVFNCYGCKRSGTLLNLVMQVKKYPPNQAREYIERFCGNYDVHERDFIDEFNKILNGVQSSKVTELQNGESLETYYSVYFNEANCLIAKMYMQTRGVVYRKLSTLTKTGTMIGYDKKQRRVLFRWGLKDLDGCMGRRVFQSKHISKYIAYTGLEKGKSLFHGMNPLVKGKVLIVEGECDALRVNQTYEEHGFIAFAIGNACASATQLNLLKSLSNGEIYIGLDRDNEGKEGQKRLVNMLSDSVCSTGIRWPQKDPADCTDREIAVTLKNTTWLSAMLAKQA